MFMLTNFYTSPAFFSDLHSHGFEVRGTVWSDRKDLTEKFKSEMPSKGQ